MAANVVNTYFKARNTIIDMFEDRKYTFNGSTDLSSYRLSAGDFEKIYNGQTSGGINISGIMTHDGKPVYVMFLTQGVITARSGTNILKKCFRDINEHFKTVAWSDDISEWRWGIDYKIIMVYDITNKDIYQETMFEKKYSHLMEVFSINRLTFNYMQHVYQPKFTLISTSSKEYSDLMLLTGQILDPKKQFADYNIKSGAKLMAVQELSVQSIPSAQDSQETHKD